MKINNGSCASFEEYLISFTPSKENEEPKYHIPCRS